MQLILKLVFSGYFCTRKRLQRDASACVSSAKSPKKSPCPVNFGAKARSFKAALIPSSKLPQPNARLVMKRLWRTIAALKFIRKWPATSFSVGFFFWTAYSLAVICFELAYGLALPVQ